ncbi:putative baseplate wedge protein [Acidovorax phage AP1]|nr:putative baseplate wedge protein [Acidovorax phage AP1]
MQKPNIDQVQAAREETMQTVLEFAERARTQYESSKEWTSMESGSCMTIRVPVALLNRIREMGEAYGLRQS